MNEKREWDFSPSYDLTYVINKGASSEHQLSINNQPASWATNTDLEAIAHRFGVKEYKTIISNTLSAKHELLTPMLLELDVPQNWIDEILENTQTIDKQIS